MEIDSFNVCIAGKSTVYYYYHAAGTKLAKKINDYSSGSLVVKNYLYLRDFIYCNDTLQYALHEEGRIRLARKRNYTTGVMYDAYKWDYFLRDHLCNVRTVLTEGRDTLGYIATMETARGLTIYHNQHYYFRSSSNNKCLQIFFKSHST